MSVLKTLILIAALVWVGKMFVDAVREIRAGTLELHLQASWLVVSAALVLVAYGVLIATWLYIVSVLAGRSLPFMAGTRIWFISNLAQLLPGRVWGILQMGAMSTEEGIGAVPAAAASIINAAVNIACGMAVGVIAGTRIFAAYLGDHAWMAWVAAGLAVCGVILLPVLLPYAFRFVRDRFHVAVPEQRTPAKALIIAAFANIFAWFLYGGAFLALSRGILGVDGTLVDFTAAFAISYVLGYVFIIVPMGMGVREKSLTTVLSITGLVATPQANAISVVSRLWLLIIQVLPALLFLLYRRPPVDEKSAAG